MLSGENYDHLFKFLIIGDSQVGKSCLLLRYADDTYTESDIFTIGVDFKIKCLNIDGINIKTQTWDLPRQTKWNFRGSSFYRGANAIIIVFDLTNAQSFKNIEGWLKECDKYLLEHTSVILVGNKADLPNKRNVDSDSVQEFMKICSPRVSAYIETSAKNASNVDLIFETAAKTIYQQKFCKPENNKLILGKLEMLQARLQEELKLGFLNDIKSHFQTTNDFKQAIVNVMLARNESDLIKILIPWFRSSEVQNFISEMLGQPITKNFIRRFFETKGSEIPIGTKPLIALIPTSASASSYVTATRVLAPPAPPSTTMPHLNTNSHSTNKKINSEIEISAPYAPPHSYWDKLLTRRPYTDNSSALATTTTTTYPTPSAPPAEEMKCDTSLMRPIYTILRPVEPATTSPSQSSQERESLDSTTEENSTSNNPNLQPNLFKPSVQKSPETISDEPSEYLLAPSL